MKQKFLFAKNPCEICFANFDQLSSFDIAIH